MRYSYILPLMLLGSSAAAATGAAWLSYPGSAANVAEAGGLGVMAGGSESMGLNPAGLAAHPGQGEIHFSHSAWAADIRSESLGAAVAGPAGSTVGLAGRWVDFGSVQGYRLGASGAEATGAIQPSAGSLDLAAAKPLGSSGLVVAAGAGVVTQNLEGRESSSAATAQAGLLAPLGAGWRASLSAVNLGGSLDGSDLPGQVRLGLAFQGAGLVVAAELAEGIHAAVRPDLQAAVRYRFNQALSLRAGWAELADAEGYGSLGVGFQLPLGWNIDYAFRSQGSLGASHHLGLAYHWD